MRWILVAHEQEIPEFNSFSSRNWRTVVTGVGQFNSLARLSALFAHDLPEGALLLGTAGCTGSEHIHRVYQVQHFAYPSIAGEDLPEFLERAFTCPPLPELAGFAAATVIQNYGVSIDTEKFLANTRYVPQNFPQPILENMEATSLAWLCRERGVRFSALLYTTNTIGAHSRKHWKENFHRAGSELAKIMQGLRSGFP